MTKRWPMEEHVSVGAWLWWNDDFPSSFRTSEQLVAEAFANPSHPHHEHAKEITAYFIYRRLTDEPGSPQ